MTFAAALLASLLRSAAVAVCGAWLARELERGLRALSGRRAAVAWILVLLPATIPSVMTGYCYRDTAMSLIRHPQLVEVLYTLLVSSQAIPLAVVLLRFAPPVELSPSAAFLARRIAPRGISRWRLWFAVHRRSTLPAGALLFLLAFQEADLAALMQSATWTEWLFTKHIGGLPQWESVRYAAWPVLLQAPVLGVALLWFSGGSATDASRHQSAGERVSATSLAVCATWCVLAVAIAVIVPAWQLQQGARQGWPALFHQPSTWRELSDALLLAVTCGGAALGAGWAMRCGLPGGGSRRMHEMFGVRQGSEDRRWDVLGESRWDRGGPLLALRAGMRRAGVAGRVVVLGLAVLGGLAGSLTLGLFLLAIFQSAWLLPAYDSPAPLILGMTLVLLPRALILLTVLSRSRGDAAGYVLELLGPKGGSRRRAHDSRPLGAAHPLPGPLPKQGGGEDAARRAPRPPEFGRTLGGVGSSSEQLDADAALGTLPPAPSLKREGGNEMAARREPRPPELRPRVRPGSARLAWRVRGRLWGGAAAILAGWAYLEVMLPSILAPPGMVPVGLVLYNSLHYGRISALAAKVVLALAVPAVLLAGFLGLRRIAESWRR